ncbi:MAG: sugar phosphate nucleotidyltransferase, partial [Planctomycetota bacterium]
LREAGSGIPAGRGTCYSVARFREKPDAETARSYLKTGGYYWNAGIFLWHLATFRRSLAATAPDLEAGWERLSKLGPALEEDDHPQVRELFVGLRKISIDFALLEKASNVRVVEATFSWDDVGSWRSLERYRQGDEHGNITEGRVVLEAAGGNTVLASGSRVIALMGVQDLVVVDAPGALLICPKDRVEEIKKLVDQVSDRGWEEVL